MADKERGVQEYAQFRLISSDRVPAFGVDRVAAARAEPPVRGEGVLRRLDMFFVRLTAYAQQAVPAPLNPFVQMGAVANTAFLIALVSGILLLFWYSPSIHHAYGSVERMHDSPYLAGLLRSLHRYSSDACMLFAVLHGFQTFFARKIGGARWLAWVSGIVLIGLVWFDGWTGYWLVWDERARQVALGTARLVDVLPLFPDPLARSFLTDDGVNSLLFFLIFFLHMLIPLALGVFLWVHIMRLNTSKFLTNKALSAVILVALVVVSLLVPATSAGPASMQVVPQDYTVDWYYLLPLFFTDRLQGGLLWAVVLVAAVVLFGMPWWIARRRPVPAVVDEDRCSGCMQCYLDCPFNAVSLLPRPDGTGENPVFARIDPDMCVGCGICVGSCDTLGIDQARLPLLDIRRWINHRARTRTPEEDDRYLAFVCAESAGADLRIDADGRCERLPGYRVVPVPCAGWVHMITVEQALRRGARGVLIAGCDAHPVCRKGALWTEERLAGEREPFLRRDKVAAERVRYVRYDRSDTKALLAAAAAFRDGSPAPALRRTRPAAFRYAVVASLLVGLGGLTLALSDATYWSPPMRGSELVVSFKHAGQVVEAPEGAGANQDDLLPHMRGASATRQVRTPVRLRVFVDGRRVVNRAYEPGGLFNDGSSIAIEPVPVPAGTHRVRVQLGDAVDHDVWTYEDERDLGFKVAERRVILFDAVSGFTWY